MAKTTKAMDSRRAQLVGMDCRDRLLNLIASMRTEWPGLPVEEIIVALNYALAHTMISHNAAMLDEHKAEIAKKVEEFNDEGDDDEEEEAEDKGSSSAE